MKQVLVGKEFYGTMVLEIPTKQRIEYYRDVETRGLALVTSEAENRAKYSEILETILVSPKVFKNYGKQKCQISRLLLPTEQPSGTPHPSGREEGQSPR
ncbi:hypothetical protein [Pyrococcus yayanosii]|uniref:hypothetical protein n=1 Tax=Pyrococcus yayanosii TaxID=1008460 RepID=UPI0011D19E12|nr:hypothetical protein [Pyrococcus yayanosii]